MRFFSSVSAATLFCLALTACPAPDPPKAPPPARPLNEDDAKSEVEAAKKKGDPDALLALHHKYKKFPSGKTALRLAVRKFLERALEAAEACDEPKASGAMAKVAPYTADDTEIDEAYDETKEAVSREHKRCQMVKLDADVKRAETAWDWPRAFNRILTEKEADGSGLKKRRVELLARWKTWADDTIKQIVAKKSIDAVGGDKADNLEASFDPSRFPPEIAPELGKRIDAFNTLKLVFEKLEEGTIIDPPIRYWVYGSTKARRVDTPSSVDGATPMPNGVPFFAVAKGKATKVSLLVAGVGEGDLVTRLASIKLLVPEADARTFDTRATLPQLLTGVRVLAPIAAKSDVLTPSTVISEGANGAVTVQSLGGGKKGPKLALNRKELRGMAMAPGQKVTVFVGNNWKPGELADVPEDERVLVRIAGFESYVPIGDVRVKRGDLPAPPPEE